MKRARPDEGLLRDLGIEFSRHGVTRREDRLRLVREHAGRWVNSMTQLDPAEASILLGRLRRLRVGTLPSHVDRLIREEEQAAASRAGDRDPGEFIAADVPRERVVAFVCGRGRGAQSYTITDKDMEAARLAGRQMELDVEEGR